MRQQRLVENSVWKRQTCSVAINDALAIERRGGRGGGGLPYVFTSFRPRPTTLEQGIARRPEETARAEARLVHSSSPRNRTIEARPCIFNLAIDSKLRACDLVKLRLDDICSGAMVRHRATIVQKKTGRPVQFEITEQSRSSVEAWLPMLRATGSRYLFPSRLHASPHISTRQYARLVHRWVESIGLELAIYGTHSMRRTKAAQIYRKTGNLICAWSATDIMPVVACSPTAAFQRGSALSLKNLSERQVVHRLQSRIVRRIRVSSPPDRRPCALGSYSASIRLSILFVAAKGWVSMKWTSTRPKVQARSASSSGKPADRRLSFDARLMGRTIFRTVRSVELIFANVIVD